MTFLVISNYKKTVRTVTDMLFMQFPGSIIYQYIDEDEALECVKTHQIDAVFIDGAWDSQREFHMLCGLRNLYPELSVFVFGNDNDIEEDALWNEATGFLNFSLDEKALHNLFIPQD